MGPRSRRDGLDERKTTQNTEDELQDAAQDCQDAISDGWLERLTEEEQVEGRGAAVWRSRGGFVQGPGQRDDASCSRLRLRRSLQNL